MEPVELTMVRFSDDEGRQQVALMAGEMGVVGVENLSMGSDENGSYMDLRIRRFGLREYVFDEAGGEDDTDVGPELPEEDTPQEG